MCAEGATAARLPLGALPARGAKCGVDARVVGKRKPANHGLFLRRYLGDVVTDRPVGSQRLIAGALRSDADKLPPQIVQRIDERLAAAAKKNPALDQEYYRTLAGRLENADLREVEDTIQNRVLWPLFQPRFAGNEIVAKRFDQLAELRNGIRHSRTVMRSRERSVKQRCYGFIRCSSYDRGC